ncbi:MAG: hypothetical protein JNL42_13650 [Anaerolineae bacterium]|nr:hypothetical protein [Anaerolineae bacterium]
MMDSMSVRQIVDAVQDMDLGTQRKVLDFARGLVKPKGMTGAELMRLAVELNFDSQSLDEMQQAIAEAFERIDDLPEINLDGE